MIHDANIAAASVAKLFGEPGHSNYTIGENKPSTRGASRLARWAEAPFPASTPSMMGVGPVGICTNIVAD